jgi:hypothetical protein
VAVAWITAPDYPDSLPASRFARKRSLLWQNTARNQRIADVAQALSSGDQHRIARLELADSAAWLWETETLPDLGIVIVVESAEHGRALGELLPGWRLARATSGVEDNDDSILLRGNAIATFTCTNQGMVAANVVIYAAGYGGRWIEQLGPQWRGLQGDRMLVIDVDDGYDPDIHHDVIQRVMDYGRRSWTQFLTSMSGSTVRTRTLRRGKATRNRKRRHNRSNSNSNS